MGKMRDVFHYCASALCLSKPQGVLYRFKRNKTQMVLKRALSWSIVLWVCEVFLGPFKGEALYQDLDSPFSR